MMNTVTLKFCFTFLTLEVCLTCYAKKTCICNVGQMPVHLLLSKQFLNLSWLPDPLNMGLNWDSKSDTIDNLLWYADIHSLYRPDLSTCPSITTIFQKSNNIISVLLCMGATFVNKNSCLVGRIVSFDTAGLHLFTFRILEPYPSKDIDVDFSHVTLHQWRYYGTLQLSLI